MTSADDVRRALVASHRWADLVKQLDVIAMGIAGPLEPDDWTDTEREAVVLWSKGELPFPPSVVGKYIVKVSNVVRDPGRDASSPS